MPRSCSVTSPSLPNGELLLLLLLLLWWHAVGVLLHAVSTRLEHAVRRLLIAVVIRRRLRHISVLQVSRRVGRRRSGVPTHHNSDGPSLGSNLATATCNQRETIIVYISETV
ncbi:hypothetical protein NP493_3908g00001 [Ridgeia piscesae]|uniref:Uncharacterized protein n=1 Tax=Ridgeia piscesae TaxID=27915 RepID=A0AAD9MVN9_RIDPI|nr:hypothetical protein NP493_3908g00001 [Ridgeia piscesae]